MSIQLDNQLNYIVSGLERSGTSMMMQILAAGELPIAYNEIRQPDEHNPKGYFELEGGKIINKLMQGTFPFEHYKGQFIKITAFGLLYLPPGHYKIIYMERNLDEVLDSMEKMTKITDENREETKQSFQKLNEKIKKEFQRRKQSDFLVMNYNEMLHEPARTIQKLCAFLKPYSCNQKKMAEVIDQHLYRQRRS